MKVTDFSRAVKALQIHAVIYYTDREVNCTINNIKMKGAVLGFHNLSMLNMSLLKGETITKTMLRDAREGLFAMLADEGGVMNSWFKNECMDRFQFVVNAIDKAIWYDNETIIPNFDVYSK